MIHLEFSERGVFSGAQVIGAQFELHRLNIASELERHLCIVLIDNGCSGVLSDVKIRALVAMSFRNSRRPFIAILEFRSLFQMRPVPQSGVAESGVHRISSRVTSFVIFSCPRITVTITRSRS